ncbi:DUF421 domain-containing protein [Georgenia sp. EYE_87]|uniref:DUF421 domain-containing protein n=1 Tax=Georgenia sp. EYE_87 TaxID=2853448 RepID=UPI0020055BDA|nr:YetF domain-containing protein [Georgenia sp. EYE_87]MCK6210748.1 DUF421 domain-containing protein [Georgenia sp. EYE_87]
MWFDSWQDLTRVLLVGAAAYGVLVLVLRLTGKRSLAKLNAFDLVVTVALGSTLATIVLSAEVSFSEGVTALALLALLQLAMTWTSSRWPRSRTVMTAEPTVVLRDGEPLHDAMRGQRLTLAELRQAVRSSGSGDLSAVGAIVLESDGTLSVIPAEKLGDGSALEGTSRPGPA